MANYSTKEARIIRTLICDICEKPFETDARNAKYCSDKCRDEGARLKREKWAKETNYNERQRERMAQERKAKREAIRRETTKVYRKQKEQAERETRERQEAKQIELKQRAEQGDNLALMRMAKPNSFEYWEAFKAYTLEEMSEYEEPKIRYVNDISILDEDFAEKVVFSIEKKQVINSYLKTE